VQETGLTSQSQREKDQEEFHGHIVDEPRWREILRDPKGEAKLKAAEKAKGSAFWFFKHAKRQITGAKRCPACRKSPEKCRCEGVQWTRVSPRKARRS
jgi:hypothetical protein